MKNSRLVFNVENELSVAIEAIGGRRVTEILGRAPGHKNADFVFLAQSIVCELKCLDENKIEDERIIEKASHLYLEELQAGRAPEIAFGTVRMTTAGFSESYKQKIGELYRISIERLARDADRQIEETSHALKIMQPLGLFLLANNNHSALDPQHAWYIVNQILAQDKYSHINAAVVFSGNLAAGMPDMPSRIDYWIEIQRTGMASISAGFMTSFRDAWYSRLAKVFGEPVVPVAMPADMSILSKLESR